MFKLKKRFLLVVFATFLMFNTGAFNIKKVYADSEIYVGGITCGFSIVSKGATILGLTDVITNEGIVSPLKDKGIVVGDTILSIDGKEVNNSLEIADCIKEDGEKIIKIKRKNEKFYINVFPAKDISGYNKLGVFIRENVNGIGTITFVKDNKFASLGHPIINEFNELIEVSTGKIMSCKINGVIKGEYGKAGELKGNFLNQAPIGEIRTNTESGVYGTIKDTFNLKNMEKIKIGSAKIGQAEIRTTLPCGTDSYKISIVKVDEKTNTKNFVIKIKDENLIKNSGGIVQGMSGSPIIQDGKLVGAVTHVFLNDAQRGYGISIENMLKEIDKI